MFPVSLPGRKSQTQDSWAGRQVTGAHLSSSNPSHPPAVSPTGLAQWRGGLALGSLEAPAVVFGGRSMKGPREGRTGILTWSLSSYLGNWVQVPLV